MIAIVDYGAGNLRSIQRALLRHTPDVMVTSEPADLADANRIVLPGVGAAGAAMERLRRDGLADALISATQSGTPLLGICLGMQLLFEDQEEGPTTGLGLLKGSCKRLTGAEKIPHMGWNTVDFSPSNQLSDVESGRYYFVHSYVAHPDERDDIAATTDYGSTWPSIVIHDAIWGMQFHPEKSGERGVALLGEWIARTKRRDA